MRRCAIHPDPPVPTGPSLNHADCSYPAKSDAAQLGIGHIRHFVQASLENSIAHENP